MVYIKREMQKRHAKEFKKKEFCKRINCLIISFIICNRIAWKFDFFRAIFGDASSPERLKISELG
jgi:hypothetical protein